MEVTRLCSLKLLNGPEAICARPSMSLHSSLIQPVGLTTLGSFRRFDKSSSLKSLTLFKKPQYHARFNSKNRFSHIRCVSTQEQISINEPQSNILGEELEFTGVSSIVRGLPTPLRYALCLGIIASSAGTGYAIGERIIPPFGKFVGSILLGALGAGASHFLNESRKEVAAIELHNAIINHPSLLNLKPQEIQLIASKYGVSVQDPRFISVLKDLYDRFVTAIIPPGNENLNGNEVELIQTFKNCLALEDDDAASVHIEIGRRIFRQRMETGDKETAVEERKSFQKLVYVSNIVFGEASKFLLPWKRVFKITDSQIDVAIRYNAQSLFQVKLDASNAEPDIKIFKELRFYQLKYKLNDQVASEMFNAAARSRIEKYIGNALEILKSRSRIKNMKQVVIDVDEILGYNDSLSSLAKDLLLEEGEILPGVGPISISGGIYDNEKSMDDLKLIYSSYLSEALLTNMLTPNKVEALSKLRNVFGLGIRECDVITQDVTTKVYKKKLAHAFNSDELDKAPSKAQYLENLCETLNFDPEKAFAIHEEIYRQKLEQSLEDKVLSDDDIAALLRIRVLLCIPQHVVDNAHAEICGRIFTKVVDEVMSTGEDGYGGDTKKNIQDAVKGLRLPVNTAIEIASKAIKGVFLAYAKRVKSMSSRVEAGRELKKMVMFSNITVADLLDSIRESLSPSSEEATATTPEEPVAEEKPEDLEPEFEDEVLSMQTLRKTRGPAKEGRAQKEVTIRDELELRDRTDLYRTFLMYCIQGERTNMPMGTSVVVKKDASDFVRLGQLGDILGLSSREVSLVHQGLAEQAFKTQAETLLADGQLSKARVEQLKKLQQQLGLPDAPAQKIIQTITSTKMAGAIDQAVQAGKLSVEDIKELRASGVNIESMVSATVRQQLFKKLVEKTLSSGSGEFNEEDIYVSLPADLGLDASLSVNQVKEIAKEKIKGSLIQAVALLRQRKQSEVVSALNNILACDKANHMEDPLSWAVREELADLYGIFLAQNGASDQTRRLCELLDIDESMAQTVEDMVASGGFSLDTNEESFVF